MPKMTLCRSFRGLRHQNWDFPGFKSWGPEKREKRRKMADFRRKTRKTENGAISAQKVGFSRIGPFWRDSGFWRFSLTFRAILAKMVDPVNSS
jgi:hypothetical protein